jgi:hypothetical protein
MILEFADLVTIGFSPFATICRRRARGFFFINTLNHPHDLGIWAMW